MEIEERILKILKNSAQTISGETLAQGLGVSRVAIWKAIHKLKNKGLPIQASKKGYFLEDKDLLIKEELEEFLKDLSFWKEAYLFWEIPSTMEVAKSLAESHKKALVLAEKQIAGRGRRERFWESPKGGIWLTLVFLEPWPLREAFLLTYLSAVAVAKAIRETYGISAQTKWPNDVLIKERKVAGILFEIKAEVDSLKYALIGIGINVNNPVKDKAFLFPAISIAEALGRKVERLPLLKSLLRYFETLLKEKERIIGDWKALNTTIGKKVRVITSEGEFVGKALDIDEEGALLIELEEGSLKRIFSGDCFHLRESN